MKNNCRIFLVTGKPGKNELAYLHSENYNNIVKGIFCRYDFHEEVKEYFPESEVFVDPRNVSDLQSLFIKEKMSSKKFQDLVESKYFANMMIISERCSPAPSGVINSIEYVREAYRCALASIKKIMPTHVLFANFPHTLYSYAVYVACRLQGIETIVIRSVGGFFIHIVIATETMEPPDLKLAHEGSSENSITAYSEAAINKLKNSSIPDYLVSQGYMRSRVRLAFDTFYALFGSDIKQIKIKTKQMLRYVCGNDAQKMKKKYRLLESDLTEFEEKKYIYFSLHYQPEQTSMPYANMFAAQYLVLKELIEAVQGKLYIVVKEHPTMLLKNRNDYNIYRSHFMADLVDKNDNVYLAPAMVTSHKLLSKAKAVATLTGTVGYEALAKNVPVLVFGSAMYGASEMVYRCSDSFDVEEALESIACLPETKDTEVLKRLISSLEKISFEIPEEIFNMNERSSFVKTARSYAASRVMRRIRLSENF